MNVSSVKNLNGETFSAVQDAYLTNVVQTNSGNWQDITAYQNASAKYLTGVSIPESATWNEVSTTVQTNSAQWAEGGGDMFTSYLEYNDQNQISGYNGSAIAQYGAEKQWLVHDDTLMHVANSAQYALGCNVSALQRLMGIDETVLWSGSDMPSDCTTASKTYSLSEPYNNFKEVKIYLSEELGRVITLNGESNNFQYYAAYPEENGNKVGLLITPVGTTGLKFKSGFNSDGWTAYTGQNYGYYCLTKIVGIGRKS